VNERASPPRLWLSSAGEIGRFMANVVGAVWGLRVFRFFGESLRQAGVLIVGSALVIWSLVFITGLGTCGIEAAYFNSRPARRPTRECSLPGATCARRFPTPSAT